MAAIGDASTQRGRSIDDAARDLRHYLEGEFQDGQPFHVSSRKTVKGHRAYYELSDRFVSRLEILHALLLLPYRQRRIIQLQYGESWKREDIMRLLHIGDDTLQRERQAALRVMVRAIYEWVAARPPDQAA